MNIVFEQVYANPVRAAYDQGLLFRVSLRRATEIPMILVDQRVVRVSNTIEIMVNMASVAYLSIHERSGSYR